MSYFEYVTQNGHAFLIDEEDRGLLESSPWFAMPSKTGGYYLQRNSKDERLFHRIIMNAPPGLDVDHKSRDKSDNRKANLRLATRSQNLRNQRKKSSNTSGYKGVSRWKDKWRAYIWFEGKYVHLGMFEYKELAALAYDSAASLFFGEFAHTNFEVS